MRILVYGAGAIGCFIGGNLAGAGHQVTLLGRQPLAEAVASDGLILKSGEQRKVVKPRVVTTLQDAFSHGEGYDWIAFTMKAYDTIPSIFDLQSLNLDSLPPLVSFQNGIGSEPSLRAAFPEGQIVAATITTPISIEASGIIIEEKVRGIGIVDSSSAANPVIRSLEETDIAVTRYADEDSLKWSKLLTNMISNAVSAIVDMSPSEVFGNPALFSIERAAFLEALAILDLMEVKIVNLPGVPVRQLVTLLRDVPPLLSRPLLKKVVGGGRGKKPPSLLGAIRAGRHKTEIAWLNGAVVEAADSIDRLAPVNHALALTLSDIAAGRIPIETYRHNPDLLVATIRAVQTPARR